ncbi:hypothetical protein ColTof4_13609 [Colletotrichum tofieldiae]|nr:hypothetical protein ColTof3_14561 [Colletotrichum tofieldiae]GKT81186.1 hypothetical protein ColTof4_13609 [Colletotrichum tofieldiae]
MGSQTPSPPPESNHCAHPTFENTPAATCAPISFCFALRFRVSDAAAAAVVEHEDGGNDDSNDDDERPLKAANSTRIQTINMMFGQGFKPSADVAIDLSIQDDGLVCCHVPLDPGFPNHDVCVIEEPIDLFQTPAPSGPWSRRLCDPPWFLLLFLIAAAGLLSIGFLLLPLPTASSIAPTTAATKPADLRFQPQTRELPLPTFDDLASLLRDWIDAPLPFIVSAQDVVDRHYHAHEPPYSGEAKLPRGGNVTMSVFFAHLRHSSAALCDASTIWAIDASSPWRDDIRLLCRSTTRDAADLSLAWGRAAATLALVWPGRFSNAIHHLLVALRERAGEGGGDGDGGHVDGEQVDDGGDGTREHVRFYNRTSIELLQKLNALFFTGHGGELSSFAEVVYKASDELRAVEQAITKLVRHLSLVTAILRRDEVDLAGTAARVRGYGNGSGSLGFGPGWLRRRPWSPPAPLCEDEANLARVASTYSEAIPFLNTAVALAWVVGFTRRQVDGVIREAERQGNRTWALVGAAPTPSPPPSSRSSPLAAPPWEWWRGLQWVSESRQGTDGTELVQTYWYLPSIREAIAAIERVLSWGASEGSRWRAQWEWGLHETEMYWRSEGR